MAREKGGCKESAANRWGYSPFTSEIYAKRDREVKEGKKRS